MTTDTKPETSFLSGTAGPENTPFEWPVSKVSTLTHPAEVVDDPQLTPDEKREILASWASDAHAVANAPALRQIDSGAIVCIDDVLQALRSLNEDEKPGVSTLPSSRPLARRQRVRSPRWLRLVSRRSRADDDDDPPPCPAGIATPNHKRFAAVWPPPSAWLLLPL